MLCRKENKTEKEESAAREFNRNGTYEDGHVRYIQNTEKYVTLRELGISEDQVKEGDRISLYFDNDEKLLLLLSVMLAFLLCTLVFTYIVRKSGKFAWYNENCILR